MEKIIKFLKDWTLPLSMLVGVASYFIYVSIPALDHTHHAVSDFVDILQPSLIFCMLFLSFCKVSPHDLKPHRFQLKLLAIQVGGFLLFATPIIFNPDISGRLLLESAMICLICPTGTAAVVLVSKLKGNVSYTISYTCLINIIVALVFPAVISVIHTNNSDTDFLTSFFLIMGKVSPLLVFPLLAALIVRYMLPNLLHWLQKRAGAAFYLWAVSLSLCIAITTKAIMHSNEGWDTYLLIGIVSAACCILQFKLGHVIGARHNGRISCGQCLGQKNTAFAIWLAYTFMNPVTAIAGGFYVIWHNTFNSIQLYQSQHNHDLSK